MVVFFVADIVGRLPLDVPGKGSLYHCPLYIFFSYGVVAVASSLLLQECKQGRLALYAQGLRELLKPSVIGEANECTWYAG